MITSKLTSRARTTLPKAVRKALHLYAGDTLAYEIVGREATLKKARRSSQEDDRFAVVHERRSVADELAYADL